MDRLKDRTAAGRRLAQKLAGYAPGSEAVIIAAAPGGVPVAYEIALRIHAPLDLRLVQSVRLPHDADDAMVAAVAADGTKVLDPKKVQELEAEPADVERAIAHATACVAAREIRYRLGRTRLDVTGKTVLLVDDGAETGSTLSVAIKALRHEGAGRIVVAVPVLPQITLSVLQDVADAVVFLATPEPFRDLCHWYYDFTMVTDSLVKNLIAKAAALNPAARLTRVGGSHSDVG